MLRIRTKYIVQVESLNGKFESKRRANADCTPVAGGSHAFPLKRKPDVFQPLSADDQLELHSAGRRHHRVHHHLSPTQAEQEATAQGGNFNICFSKAYFICTEHSDFRI